MRPVEIRNYKIELRQRIKQERRDLDPEFKAQMDKAIAENVRRLHQYKRCDTLLVYVSTPIEVDTFGIIKNAWQDGKKVAVPRCVPETRELTFHYITDFSELSSGTFNVLEPAIDSPKVTNYSGCLMLVPALMFDLRGYRLGYGMGYYDRCMANFEGPSAGICYMCNVKYHMPNGRFDRPVDILVTENWIRSKKHQKKRSFRNND
jgi:5-formyltetrahydrofolate cyclo-ligase